MKGTRLLALLALTGTSLVGCGDDGTSPPDAFPVATPDASPRVEAPAVSGVDLGGYGPDLPIDVQPTGGLDAGATGSGPPAPVGLSIAPGDVPSTAKVSFISTGLDAGASGLTFTVTANPGAITAAGTASPILVTGLVPQTAYSFTLVARDGVTSSAPATTGLLGFFDVVETFHEPMTQPNDSIFTGSFTFDFTSGTVSNLAGSLTESMTKVNGVYGGPMTTVALTSQLSSEPAVLDGASGLLVTTFALATTDTFTGGGFAPGGTQYYGLLEGTPNNHNAYATVFVNTTDPTAAATQAQVDKLAYADCTGGGMMMKSCMTGTSVSGYGVKGTMGGYPLSQVITRR